MTNPIREMLLIENPSILKLYLELTHLAMKYLAPAFSLALVLEYLNGWNFPEVVKKLFIIVVFLSFFQSFHEEAVKVSLDTAYSTLKKIDPTNLFVKKWYHSKIETKENSGWNFIQKLVIPNLNDLLGTAFYLLARVSVWFLKLIYSTVYHLTYVFAPVTAILYFFNWTNKGLMGTVQSSLWCILMPFVVIAVFALVGNALDDKAASGEVVGDIETIIWLFGVSLVLLITPVITWAMVKGDGIAASAGKLGSIAVKGMTTAVVATTVFKNSKHKGGV